MKQSLWLSLVLLSFFCMFWQFKTIAISTLAKNDPYPIYSTSYPYTYLLQNTQNYYKCLSLDAEPAHFYASVSPFYQKSNRGRNYDRESVPLGDLEGRWHMLGMLYGEVPPGETLVGTQLGVAKEEIFNVAPNTTIPADQILSDTSLQIGYLSVPIKYRKTGVRFELAFAPIEEISFLIQGGYADIKQTLTAFDNLTQLVLDQIVDNGGEDSEFFRNLREKGLPFTFDQIQLINSLLMTTSVAERIFREQGLESCDFRETSFEDLRLFLQFRHIFHVNKYDAGYPEFLMIPFLSLEGSIPFAKKQDRIELFALPFGNDGHASVAVTPGINFDFFQTIQIGLHGGVTWFNARDIEYFRVPNTLRNDRNLATLIPLQTGVFPFATTVRNKPGRNTHFGLLFQAYRFLGNLSFHAEYNLVNHDENKISIITPGPRDPQEPPEAPSNRDKRKGPETVPPWLTREVECLSKFSVQLLTTAMNYDISPNIRLGFGVQWPLKQRNAYRSTTVIGSIIGVF